MDLDRGMLRNKFLDNYMELRQEEKVMVTQLVNQDRDETLSALNSEGTAAQLLNLYVNF